MPSNSSANYFPLHLAGEFSDDGRRLTLDRPFIFEDFEKGIRVEVPAGFQTDFNSVPRPLWGYFPPWQYPEAGVIHDWLYKSPQAYFQWKSFGDGKLGSYGFDWFPATVPLERQQCDDIHRRILDLKGCRWTKRQLAYAALRSGGWVPWNKYRSVP